ncbi:MAG: arylsulfatase [Candidatus Glassbacteria bacterium]
MSRRIGRRRFIHTAGASLSALAFPSLIRAARAANASRPPNIVFILADDLGIRHLGCYGGDKISTPNIDRLAAEGLRFTQTYAGCTVCAPSRSVLMTGLHMGHAPVRANSGGVPIRDGDVTIAEVLKQAGYATGGFGKWGLGEINTSGVPTRQGFDEFVGYLHQIHAHFYYPEYLWKNEMLWPLPGNQTGGRLPGDAGGQRTQYAPDEILDHALSFIRANQDRPFFCYLPTVIPHVELAVPEEDLAPYLGKFGREEPFYDPRPGYAGSPHPRATFAAMVSHLDGHVGRVLSLLEELGLEDDTIVIFTSDNGAQGGFGSRGADFFQFFEPMGKLRGSKGSLYEGGIRVPMIARWPGRIAAGAVDDKLAWYFPDVLPTLAELAGAKPPAAIDGMSVVPALIGEKAAGRKQTEHEYLYWEMAEGPGLRQALRLGNWKAVREQPGGEIELFDLKNDESETKNVAVGHPEVMEKVNEILAGCRTEPMPQVEPKAVKDRRYF